MANEKEPEILETWDGPVCSAEYERYYPSMLTAEETDEAFLIPCDSERVPELDYDDVIERYLESLELEDYVDESHLHGTEELKAAIKVFNRANDGLNYYSQIPGKLVRVQPAKS